MAEVSRRELGRRKKKLIDAARHWAGVTPEVAVVDAGVAAALAAFGARPVDVDTAVAQADRDFEVYPENWKAVQVFLAMSTQWRTVAFSTMAGARLIHTGLDYTALEPVMRLLGVKSKRRVALFQKLRIMEEAALDAVLPS